MADVKIEDRPPLRLAAMPHKGPYYEIGNAFQKLAAAFATHGLWPKAGPMVGIYYDDPSSVPAEDLTSHAGITVAADVVLPDGVEDIAVAGGRMAVYLHKGPYANLPLAWSHVYGDWLPGSGEEVGDSVPYEYYLNDPSNTAPDDLRTEICVPLKPQASSSASQ